MKTLKFVLIALLAMAMFPTLNAQAKYNHDYGYNGHNDHYRNSYKPRDNYKKSFSYDRNTIESLEYRIVTSDRRGELSRSERKTLDRELLKLKKLESKIFRNNRVTENERRKLEQEKMELDRLIDRYTHNRKRW